MTKLELLKALEGVPDDMDIMIHQNNDEFTYVEPVIAQIHPIRFKGEGIPKHKEPTINCFLISDL